MSEFLDKILMLFIIFIGSFRLGVMFERRNK